MMVTAFDRILEKFPKRERAGRSFKVLCPAHADRNPSLLVTPAADRVLLDCKAGCNVQDVVAALGLTLGDLFNEPKQNGHAQGAPRRTRYRVPIQTEAIFHVRIDKPDGTKSFYWERNGEAGLNGLRPQSFPLFGSETVPDDTDGGAIVVLAVEGEKAQQAARRTGLPVVAIYGADCIPDENVLGFLQFGTVVLWPDNDDAGQTAMDKLGRRLRAQGTQVHWFDWQDAPPKGDAYDFLQLHPDPAILREAILAAPEWEPSVKNLTDEADSTPESVRNLTDGDWWEEPEDIGAYVRPPDADRQYVFDLVKPGRVLIVAGTEGQGKSTTAAGEIAIRLALGLGDVASTWPVLEPASVLLLSEMVREDEADREDQILAVLGRKRAELKGRYYRRPILGKDGKPIITSVDRCTRLATWLSEKDVNVLMIDTGTSATAGADPWGSEIQQVYACLRLMQYQYPALAIVVTVHFRKPQGRGDRQITDVIGEWARWADILLMMEADGTSLTRAKLTLRKRVSQERRIQVTKRDGLLVEPVDLENVGPKVSPDKVLATIIEHPGSSYTELGGLLGVTRNTAKDYVAKLEKDHRVESRSGGARGAILVFPHPSPVN